MSVESSVDPSSAALTGLRSRWTALWRWLGGSGDGGNWFSRLQQAYGEPARHYHNLVHLAEVLEAFDTLREESVHPDLVELAVWFHDVVYVMAALSS